jgi:hypothetical protein
LPHVNLAVGDEGGGPDAAVGFVGPEVLAGLGVEAVDVAVVFGLVNEALVDAGRGNRAADTLVGPEGFAGDVAAALEVEAAQHADAVAVLGILADDDVGAVSTATTVAMTSLGPSWVAYLIGWPFLWRYSGGLAS